MDSLNRLKRMENKSVLDMYAHNYLAERIKQRLRERDIVNIALSGGTTPENTYSLLGKRKDIDWSRVNIFLVDERFVPMDDVRSNSRLIIPNFPTARFYHVDTLNFDNAEEAAKYYEVTMKRHVVKMTFDLISLGLGADGHTASLFPGSDALNSLDYVTHSHGCGTDRVTMTIPLINKAKEIVFIVGPGRPQALNLLMEGADIPASKVKHCNIIACSK